MKTKWIVIIVTGVLTLWVINLAIFFNYKNSEIGQFGDIFGAVNALFSGLAFVGIIVSIRMQGTELKLQRQELQLQRTELEETRKVFVKQSNIMDEQQNDNTFFNLLANHRQMVESLRTSRSRSIGKSLLKSVGTVQDPVSGYEVIDNLANEWIDYFLKYSEIYRTKEILDFERRSPNPVKIMESRTDLVTLFHEILNVYDFVNKRFSAHDQKKFYSDTLWTNLSYSEKFIFEAYLFNFPLYQKDRNHKIETYSWYDFVDFNTLSIPEVEVKEKSTKRDEPGVIIKHNCKIISAHFVAYTADYNENIVKIVGVSEITIDEPNLPLHILINLHIPNVNSEISGIPYNDSIKLAKYHYAIYCIFIDNGEKFKLCFNVDLTSSTHSNIEGKERLFHPVFNGNRIQKISDEWKVQIFEQLKSEQ